ncbi:MAG: outer membrane lipoprotein chaperone LolA [Burkholderiaceae bacterium]|jgi:outer membrane lipoprotein carrier protein|nr:outer membrane lipoprotein chaperone LolA [Burkholderiaceae bacterium]
MNDRIRSKSHLSGNRRHRGLFASLALFALLASPAAWASGLDSLEQFIKTTRSGKADFTQVVTTPGKNGQLSRSKTQQGSFEFQRPGKFRFIYRQPFEQTIVADGQTLWLYDADLNQVTTRKQEQALGSTPAAIVASASDLKALEKSFTLINEPDQDGLQWLLATPKTPDTQIQSVRVGFKPTAGSAMLSILEIIDSFGQRSVLNFTNVQNNAVLPAQTFEFRPPAGADVIRE